jgi:hypothetical protein
MTIARIYSLKSYGLLPSRLGRSLLFCLVFSLCALPALAQSATQAKAAYDQASADFKSQQNLTNAWQFGRACFDLAEFATNKAERATLAEQGIAACKQAIELDPKSAPAHYYLGLNLGQLARTRGLSALKIIKQMEAEWQTAAQLDSKWDHAGPERSLGMLYRDTPSFASIGSRTKARHQLMRAIELAPHFPENRFELIETYLEWGDAPAARTELKSLEDIWPAAHAELGGPQWAEAWKQWDARLEKIKRRVGESSKLETPRH